MDAHRLQSPEGLSSDPSRRGVWLLILIVAALAVASVTAARWDRWPGDLQLMRLLQGALNSYTRPVVSSINTLGNEVLSFFLSLGIAGWLAYRRQRSLAAILLGVMALEVVAVTVIKWAVHRPRPDLPLDLQALTDPSSYSFPSGHVAFAVAFFGILAYLVAHYWGRSGWPRRTIIALILTPAVLMGPARVAWGVHWPSDVLGGYLLAILGIQLLIWLDHRRETASHRHSPALAQKTHRTSSPT